MYPRKRLDWTWRDVSAAVWFLLVSNRRRANAKLRSLWGDGATPFFSIRTGWHAYLTGAPWARGSAVAMSAVTIPHMRDLVLHHGYRVVAIDIDPDTLTVDPRALAKQFEKEKPRAFVFAHLLGSRSDLSEVRDVCDRFGVELIEDCAQAYIGFPETDPIGDVAMYSFGTIKTCTALGGAMFVFRSDACKRRTENAIDDAPRQRRIDYLKKILKSVGFLILANRGIFRLFVRFSADHDETIRILSRGFSGPAWIEKIEHRPSTPLLAMMARRHDNYRATPLWRRRATGEFARAAFDARGQTIVGARARRRTHWLLAITSPDPERFVQQAVARGFDATRGTSVMVSLGAPHADRLVDSLVYLPCYGGLKSTHYKELALLEEPPRPALAVG